MSSGVAAKWVDPQASEAVEPPRLQLVPAVSATPPSRLKLWSQRTADRAMGACSLIATTPLLDIRDFDWTQMLRNEWQAIRAEALGGDAVVTSQLCPATAAVIRSIPGLHTVRFQRIGPGRSRPNRILAERALLTCHLGLVVPRDGDLRMRLGERTVRWAEGETLLFDGSHASEWCNDGPDSGLLLSVQLRRPLSRRGRWIADALLRSGR